MCISCQEKFDAQSDAIKCFRNECIGKICHKCLAGLFVSISRATIALIMSHFIPCPICRFAKSFVVKNAKNGEDYSTNSEFKQPIFYKHIRQVITDGIPMLQTYLDSILKKLCLSHENLQHFFKSLNIGCLNQPKFDGVKQFVHFCGTNIGAQSYSSLCSVKMSELRRAMDYLGDVAGNAFLYGEKQN